MTRNFTIACLDLLDRLTAPASDESVQRWGLRAGVAQPFYEPLRRIVLLETAAAFVDGMVAFAVTT